MGTNEFISQILPLKNNLMRAAYRITGDVVKSEQIVQDVMIRLWSQRKNWAVIEDLPTYSLVMTRNLALESKHINCETEFMVK